MDVSIFDVIQRGGSMTWYNCNTCYSVKKVGTGCYLKMPDDHSKPRRCVIGGDPEYVEWVELVKEEKMRLENEFRKKTVDEDSDFLEIIV
jgi:hypothetical protein